MKKTTATVSGSAKDRLIDRFLKEAVGLSTAAADKLARQTSRQIRSIEVNPAAAGMRIGALPQRPVRKKRAPKKVPQPTLEASAAANTHGIELGPAGDAPAAKTAPAETAAKSRQPVSMPTSPVSISEAIGAIEAKPFDPFCFGLVPTLQREGSERLADRLAGITSIENLRAMAKAQSIVLPRELRTGEASIETVRKAVLKAVERRIADRRSAAS